MAVILTKRKGGTGASSLIQLFITGEKVAGDKDHSNMLFNTSRNYVSGSLEVYYNGQRLSKDDDYLETGAQAFTLKFLRPYSDDKLIADYIIPVT
jgi:hypothetical protein